MAKEEPPGDARSERAWPSRYEKPTAVQASKSMLGVLLAVLGVIVGLVVFFYVLYLIAGGL